MYLAEYDENLGGWWTKFRDKVIRPVLHVGAAVVTGGASIPASLALENAIAQRKAQAEAQAQAEAAAKEYAAMYPSALTPQVLPPQGVSQAQLVATPGSAFPTMLPASPQVMPMWPGAVQQSNPTTLIGAAAAAAAIAYLFATRRGRR